MLESGYIKLYRSLVNWEWYTDKNVKILFLHLLLTVNYEPAKWRGEEVKKGQRITSYSKLSVETGLTVKEVRTALEKLKRTHDVAVKTSSKYSIISVINYDKYQEKASIRANEGQTKGKQGANEGQAKGNKGRKKKKAKEEKEIIKEYNFSDDIEKILYDWLKYKAEIKDSYKATGFKSFLSQVKNKLSQFSEKEIISSFENSMANGWKGWNYGLKEKKETSKGEEIRYEYPAER